MKHPVRTSPTLRIHWSCKSVLGRKRDFQLATGMKQVLFVCTVISLIEVKAETVGLKLVGAPGITETVRQIMARESPVRQTNQMVEAKVTHPLLIPGWPQEPLLSAPGLRPPPLTRPFTPVEGFPGVFTPQIAGTSFLGAQISDTVGYIPPDSMGAVGPSQVVVIVNGRIKVFDKLGNLGGLNATTDAFFNSVRNGAETSDPHVRYDRLSGRWFVVMINISSTDNRILLAVSSGPIITDATSFTFYQFVGQSSRFADYPTLGVDKSALYIGANMFTSDSGSFSSTRGFVVNKTNLLAGALTVTTFANLHNSSGDGMLTPQGVDNDDPGAAEGYFVGLSSFVANELVVRRVLNPDETPTLSPNLTIAVPTIAAPISQVHKGNTLGKNLDAVGTRLFAAAVHKNKISGTSSLWTAHNIQVNSSGVGSSSGGRNGSRWYEIGTLTTTPTLVQAGTLFDSASSNPRGFWIPSVAASGQGHMALGCSYASVDDYAGVAVAGRLRSDAAGSIQSPTLAVVSASAYNINETPNPHRWGDFSQTVVDPNDDMTLWTFQEYCNSVNSWGVQAIQLKAPPPATPASVSPASVVQGQSAVNVILTGTSVSGSEFFDPGPDAGGPGFANHITASVNGVGVTVNSVTFSSPTSVTLNLTVSATAATGTRAITVTNPDGQSANSASGILTVTPLPVVVDRMVFYNHSVWDGNNAAANAGDDNAIATNKTALLPGNVATFTNYTSYSRGLNGIMVDISNLPATPTASDFTFKVGNSNNLSGWDTAPDPVSIAVRPGAGTAGSDRVTLIWNDNNLDAVVDANEAVAKQWLQITVKATANTGLAADDTFYFGNAVGECGNNPSAATVDTTDVLLPFYNQTAAGAASLTSAYDFNRDRSVDTTDVLLPFYHQTGVGTALALLDLSGPAISDPVGTQNQPMPMSLQDLAALFAGQGPGRDWVADGANPNRLGRLTVQRVGADQLRLHLAGVSGLWELQFSDNPQHAPWQKFEAAPEVSSEGSTWLLPIGPTEARFFRATAIPNP